MCSILFGIVTILEFMEHTKRLHLPNSSSVSVPTARPPCVIALTFSTFSQILLVTLMASCGLLQLLWRDRLWRTSSPKSSWSGMFTRTNTTRRKTWTEENNSHRCWRLNLHHRTASVFAPRLSLASHPP